MSFFKRLIPLKAQMNIILENVSVHEGQPFKGSATLSSDDNFQVEHVRMEIRVFEKYTEDQWVRTGDHDERRTVEKKDTRYSQNVTISQPFNMTKGDRPEFPFEVTMPMYERSRSNGGIIYSLKAVANVKGRPDVTKEVNPMIMPAPPSPVQVVERQVVQETIKIMCPYHKGMITLTAGINNCPQCGAPIKIG